MNIEQVRFNMIEQQIRPWDVLNQTVLDLLVQVKREDFVPAQYSTLAFVDMEIPLGHDEVMMSPKLEARILQEVAVQPTDTVLEIGTGSGYLTALLSHLAKRVYSVDIISDFKMQAHAKLAAHGIKNVNLESGDAAKGWSKHGKYDVIIVTGSLPVLPESMLKDLNIGGRLFAITGDAPAMSAQLITCMGADSYNTVTLFETNIKPLKNAVQPERFVF
ncbi:protein-L-isoaspartate O-methyltransferase family protein [Sulfuriferula nivalis]|uniref:Protein-L-isoaspartate O-methyltransferase n=1 Tax=Sulfuriferula nivalis TaxID=2675298 RepID=A0A809SAD4_9PROT|nr:protein-L-isoaspartate O-methyltransferase [Sulfuriferula nivalis]BBP01923.1 protein-L-isoaspartate O-methyltransferase [Sulfuriferula nivalis]